MSLRGNDFNQSEPSNLLHIEAVAKHSGSQNDQVCSAYLASHTGYNAVLLFSGSPLALAVVAA